MKAPELHEFSSGGELAAALADRTVHQLRLGVESNGTARLVVSGGRTPVQFFGELSGREFDWAKVEVILADERWVPADTPRSNATLVRQHLLCGPARKAEFAALYANGKSPEEAAQALCDRLGSAPFDAVVLGMGNDGHTASLFPDAPQIADALSSEAETVMVMTPSSQPEVRLSLSAKALTNTRFLALHIEGAEKRAVLEQALEEGPVDELPVRAILHNDILQAEVYWCP